ncbi:GspE/PulE family protein [Saccharicrinis aurantiacus]|uniref:GspE/PulE family protein n=1 Tax=Saccharicrinis aurantiacus TaxID=1849719 RepID=UPI0008391D12|nr:GspE/PulE family protein [Saccharicrinis aurantiacus]
MSVPKHNISSELRQTISTELAWQYSVIPFKKSKDQLFVYLIESSDIESTINELQIILGVSLTYETLKSSVINELLARFYPRSKANTGVKVTNVEDNRFVESLISESQQLGSSDIHLEPFEKRSIVRVRIDGKLIERYHIPKSEYSAVVNKIKILSNLDISEKRLPQDGRMSINNQAQKFDVRVSILPILHGEKVVMRILSNDANNLNMDMLGFNSYCNNLYREAIKKPNGIILISGPTGSGKTTTLYATLKEINKPTHNILTVEDPIEYTLEGINQVQLKEDIGLDFAATMRTFLRQDPDIIMVGEIRDVATAQMAVRAALTGHLVFSTIHTSSALGIISRLVDMGIPSFMVANTLNLAVAQRLVRLLCPLCKEKKSFHSSSLPSSFNITEEITQHYVPVGCDSCYYTGYKGRRAIYEMISVDKELQISMKETNVSIEDYIEDHKIPLLAHSAFKLILDGDTSIEEAYPILFQN